MRDDPSPPVNPPEPSHTCRNHLHPAPEDLSLDEYTLYEPLSCGYEVSRGEECVTTGRAKYTAEAADFDGCSVTESGLHHERFETVESYEFEAAILAELSCIECDETFFVHYSHETTELFH